MGVDLGIHKVAVFIIAADQQVQVGVLDLETELSRAYQLRVIGSFVEEQAVMWDVDSVWIEDTLIGNNRKYSLSLTETKGAVMAALAIAADVRLVDNNTWKKQVVGHGRASKDEVRDYIDVTYPAYAPLCGDNQDLYDAACIALHGRAIMERSRDLHLQS